MKELQEKIKKFCADNNMESPVEHRVLDLSSEVGEVAKEILKMSNYGRQEVKYNEDIKLELGDVFYSLSPYKLSKYCFIISGPAH